jgi:hypothetical protein
VTALTPDEARAAADCVAEVLSDYERLDPACRLMVWAGPPPLDDRRNRPVNEPDTQARVAAARSALQKLREVAQ